MELVDILHSGVGTVTTLVQDILDLEALESGKFPLKADRVDIRDTVRSVARWVRGSLRFCFRASACLRTSLPA